MRKYIVSGFIACSVLALSSAPVFAADACESVLCLYGKATGNSGGDACKSPEKAFFDIVKKNKHGFLPNHTKDARKNFLLQCKEADFPLH